MQLILRNCEIFQSIVSLKPYEPFSKSDRIYLFSTQNEELCDLYSQSTYFQKINEEWQEFKNTYLFYYIPNKTRKEFKSLKDEIKDILAHEISEHINSS